MKTKLKSHITHLLLCSAILSIGFTSCKDDNPKEQPVESILTASIDNSSIMFDIDGRWIDWNKNESIRLFPKADKDFNPSEINKIQYTFSHFYNGYPYGFTASKEGGNKNYPGEMLNHQFTVIPGDGYVDNDTPTMGITPFIVGNWDAYSESQSSVKSCMISITQQSSSGSRVAIEFEPVSVKVTNTCYTYYSMLEGDNFAKKFQKGDYLKLIAHGVKKDGSESTVEFYLADCRKDNSENWFVKDWQTFNLKKLGEVKAIYFTMESTDNGQYGMNTPAYFAITDFSIVNKYLYIDVD